MHRLSLKEQIFVGITLFSMFFGAGNLIFPPLLGAQAGAHTATAFAGFAVSAVGLPVLGVAAVARSGGLRALGDRVGRKFSFLFMLIIYLAIGPCLAIPRTAGTSFEMAVTPFVAGGADGRLRAAYSAVFFAVALWIAFHPSKLVDYLGKKLAPLLLLLIAVLFAGCIRQGISGAAAVQAKYLSAPAAAGFIDGYQTMDAIAALVFGIVIAMNIRGRGVEDTGAIVRITIRAGYIAAAVFLCVYGAHTYIGTTLDAGAKNGAELLTAAAYRLFGNAGLWLLAVIFIIACLNTCVGLICSCSEYFHEIVPRISYRQWAVLLAVFSMIVSNAGLNTILAVSVPLLSCLYPVAIVLIFLAFLPERAGTDTYLYPLTVLLAGTVSAVHTLDGLGVRLPLVTELSARLPLYEGGLGWILPAALGACAGLMVKRKRP